MMTFRKKGDRFAGHSHLFDHGTLLSSGSLELDVDGVKTVFTAPAIIFVGKDKIHNLVALEDNTVATCIHGLRDSNQSDDIIDPEMIPAGIDLSRLFKDTALGITPLLNDNLK
jgi:quercetin dioxygenase-like cupin family protein